jgi:hypothetical protein
VECNETSFALYELGILRAYHKEIQRLLLRPGSRFLATTGADMYVRLFSVETCEFIGTFHREHCWDVNNRTTWEKGCAVEIESEHFQ